MWTSIYPYCLQLETEVKPIKDLSFGHWCKTSLLSTMYSQLRTSCIYWGLFFWNCVAHVKLDTRIKETYKPLFARINSQNCSISVQTPGTFWNLHIFPKKFGDVDLVLDWLTAFLVCVACVRAQPNALAWCIWPASAHMQSTDTRRK